jgi:hypothetical protein
MRIGERQIRDNVQRIAADLGLTPEDVWQEALDVIAYHDRHGCYPPDIAWGYRFIEEHGRVPDLHEWPKGEGE